MAHTKILLREDVDDLGTRGEIVRVRAGYARNYLLPRRISGNCAIHQRMLAEAIKRARNIALLPYTTD